MAIAAPLPAWAEDDQIAHEDGYFTAYAYALLSTGTRIRVDPRDDADEDLALVTTFRRALERRGHSVDPTAGLVMSFDLEVEDDLTLANRPPVSPGAKGDAVVVHIGRPAGARGRADSRELPRYRLSVSLDDHRTGRRIWSAEALFAAEYRSAVTTAQAVVPVLLDSIGQTVSRLSLTFD